MQPREITMPRKPPASPPVRGKTSPSRHAARAPTRRTGKDDRTAAPEVSDAVAAVVRGPLGLATLWSQFADQMQRVSEQTWQGLRQDAEVEAEEVRRADTPQQL